MGNLVNEDGVKTADDRNLSPWIQGEEDPGRARQARFVRP